MNFTWLKLKKEKEPSLKVDKESSKPPGTLTANTEQNTAVMLSCCCHVVVMCFLNTEDKTFVCGWRREDTAALFHYLGIQAGACAAHIIKGSVP